MNPPIFLPYRTRNILHIFSFSIGLGLLVCLCLNHCNKSVNYLSDFSFAFQFYSCLDEVPDILCVVLEPEDEMTHVGHLEVDDPAAARVFVLGNGMALVCWAGFHDTVFCVTFLIQFIKSVGEEYPVVKRERKYYGCGEEYCVE